MKQFRVAFKKESDSKPGKFDNYEFFCVADDGPHAARQARDYDNMLAREYGYLDPPSVITFVCTPVSA